jgi:hypothetical protein
MSTSPWSSGGVTLAVHAPAPPAGFVEVSATTGDSSRSVVPPATHSGAVVQATPRIGLVPFTSILDHAPAPEVGLVELSTLPALSAATHSDDEAHETSLSWVPSSMFVAVHAPAPAIGSVEVATAPAAPLTTHSGPDTQEMLVTRFTPAMVLPGVCDQAAAPPVGSVEANVSPYASIATQSETPSQDTPTIASRSMLVTFHAPAPPAGSADVRTLPALSVATHSDVDGHDMPVIILPGSTSTGPDQSSGAVNGPSYAVALSATPQQSARADTIASTALRRTERSPSAFI